MKKILLAFDYGASSGRAIVGVYQDGRLNLDEVHRFGNDPVTIGDRFYWDTLRLFHEMKQGLRAARAKYGRIDAIGIDTWGVDYGLIGEDGNLLTNPIHYRDHRTVANREEVESVLSYEAMYERTGIAYWPFNTIYQLQADRTMRPALFSLAKKLLFTPDLLAYFLTGVQRNEYTIASTGQLVNVRTRDLDDDVLAAAGVTRDLFCPLVQPGEVIGPLADWICRELDLEPVPVVAVCTHDTASAVAAVPLEPGRRCAYLSCGTWSLLGVETTTPCTTAEAREQSFTNEAGAFGTLVFLKNINGLWLMQSLRRNWSDRKEKVSYDDIEQAARAARAAGADFAINPNDPRFMNPPSMMDAIADCCRDLGQGRPGSLGELALAVYNGLAREYARSVAALETVRGEPVEQLHMVGGGIKDRFLSELTAGSIGRPVVCGPVEASVAGNLVLQLVGLGLVHTLEDCRDIIRHSFPVERFPG